MCANSQYSDKIKTSTEQPWLKAKHYKQIIYFYRNVCGGKKEKQATAVLGFKAKRKDDMVW